MSETKHTPGPWHYTQQDQQVHLPGDHSKSIADIRGWGWIQKLPNPEEIQDANGKLIAAAPELLEALIAAQNLIEKFRLKQKTTTQNEWEQIELAIKKATE